MKTIATRTYSEKREEEKNVTEEFYSSLQCNKCFEHNAHIQICTKNVFYSEHAHRHKHSLT